jgi:purine-binding chemotaxis protein CheW
MPRHSRTTASQPMTRSCFVEAVLDEMHVAFPLADVDRIVRAVAIHPVPQGGGCLLGTIDVAGELVSVYDMRRLLGLATRPLQPDDRIVLTRVPLRCGFVVDRVAGTAEPEQIDLSDAFALHAAGLRGVARTKDGVLLVQDLRRLLALERAVPIVAHA